MSKVEATQIGAANVTIGRMHPNPGYDGHYYARMIVSGGQGAVIVEGLEASELRRLADFLGDYAAHMDSDLSGVEPAQAAVAWESGL